jgi:hypothetical protein
VKYALLNRTHPDAALAALRKHQDLFEGGEVFRARVATYLLQNEREPAAVYRLRCARAHYLNYVARIVRYFAAALFASPLSLGCEPAADVWYSDTLKEDADGEGTDLDVVLKDAFTRALVGGRAYVRIDGPDEDDGPEPASLAEAEARGLRRMRVCAVPTESIRHWKRGRGGHFEWVMEYARTEELADFADAAATVTETWTVWYEDGSAKRWALSRPAGDRVDPQTDVPEVDPPANPCGAIPIVELALPSELHLVAHVADPALEAFRKSNALSWAVDRTCYAMPAFFLKDANKPPVMGVGYYIQLGTDERVEWPAPPSAPFEVVQSIVRSLVQEIHRVVEQMALAVDNNAAATVGRSGDSKAADAAATQIVLPSFGERVREFAERILDLVARARGDRLTWSVQGMDHFDLADCAALVESAVASVPLNIASETYRRELAKAVVAAQLPHLDEGTRSKINGEIDAAPPPAPPKPAPAVVPQTPPPPGTNEPGAPTAHAPAS